MDDLFQSQRPAVEVVSPGVVLLAGFVRPARLTEPLDALAGAAGFRHMVTPGGKRIGVAVTNCGDCGWVSDRRGYRYQTTDPESDQPWPAMPADWAALARDAAAAAGWPDYRTNACLINRYLPGNRMTAHQDKNEGDFGPPVVTMSTGLAAEFQVWGETRAGRPLSIPVHSGDVLVMGGPARMHFHGVKTVRAAPQAASRISFTFRQVAPSAVWRSTTDRRPPVPA